MNNWKYDHLVSQIHRTAYKPHESFIIGSLLHDKRLEDLLPLTQHYVKRIDNKYALIDLFFPQINLAVEIDEPHHDKYAHHDNARQTDIEQNLKCNFFRISISNGNILDQIEKLKEKIVELIKTHKNSWKAWEQPKTQSIFQMKNEYKNTLFVKIKGFIKPEDLMGQQTGYWRIAQNKRDKIKTVVVVHDSVISRIFTLNNWRPVGDKVGYDGTENTQSNLLGTIVTDWKTQQTITYSNDVY